MITDREFISLEWTSLNRWKTQVPADHLAECLGWTSHRFHGSYEELVKLLCDPADSQWRRQLLGESAEHWAYSEKRTLAILQVAAKATGRIA